LLALASVAFAGPLNLRAIEFDELAQAGLEDFGRKATLETLADATVAKITSGGITYGGGIKQTTSLTQAQVTTISGDIRALITKNGQDAPASSGKGGGGKGKRSLLGIGADADPYGYCCNPISTATCNTTDAKNACLDIAAGMVQLAFHDSGTYVKATGTGGPDGCINLGLAENGGLKWTVPKLQPVYEKYNTVISYADFVQLAGKVAIETVGGADVPIPFKYGRKTGSTCGDGQNGDDVNKLPEANKNSEHVNEVFVKRMGLTVQDITALMGGHTIGRMEAANTGYTGYWDSTPNKWDNTYYVELIAQWWQRDTQNPNKVAWILHSDVDGTAKSGPEVVLHTDISLAYYIGDAGSVDTDKCQAFGSRAESRDHQGPEWLTTATKEDWAKWTSSPTGAPTATACDGKGCGKGGRGGGRGGHCQINLGFQDASGYSSYFVWLYANNEATWKKDFGVGYSKMTSLGQEANLKDVA